LLGAWKEFRRGKMQKKDVLEFDFNLEDNIFELHERLADKSYRPDAYAFFYVRDPKLRPIHKATVRDRIVFQAIFRALYPIFDRHFIFDSYSCRFSKGTHSGVERLKVFIEKASQNYSRRVFALKCDVRQFFYSVDHAVLLDLVKQEISESDAIELISIIIDSFHVSPGKGLPLGNVTSQLFANVYLNELDQYAKHTLKVKYYIRYCDDFVILSEDRPRLAGLVTKLGGFLSCYLKLALHPRKVEIRKLSQGIDFLGYVALPHYSVLRTKTKKRMFKKLSLLDGREDARLQSYLGMLKHCSGHKLSKHVRETIPFPRLMNRLEP
jgi:RNA-directed DNA polymerase